MCLLLFATPSYAPDGKTGKMDGAEGAQRSLDARRKDAAQYAMRGLSVPADNKDAWSRPKEGGGKLVEERKKLVRESAGE